MDFQPNSLPDFCPACGNLAETHRVGGPDSRVLVPRKYCSKHSRVPAGFRRLLKRLFDAAEETAAGRAFMDADPAPLESGLRHFCSEACGGGKLSGVIRDRDIKGWTLRTLGLSAEDAAVQLGVTARCVQAWRNKVASAVDRAERLAGCPTAVRDTVLAMALHDGLGQIFDPAPAADIRPVAALVNQQEAAYRIEGNAGVDREWLLASIEAAGLLSLIIPTRLLEVRPNLPTEAFHPASYLRRLIRRSRLGAPRQRGWVLSTYTALASEQQDHRRSWEDDPAVVLMMGLSVLAERNPGDEEVPLAPAGLSVICPYCWRPGDDKTGRCPQHRRCRRPPPGYEAFREFRSMLAAELRKIEPAMRQAPPFAAVSERVAIEEQLLREAQRAYRRNRSDKSRLAFQQASVRYDKLSQDENLVINSSTISYVAFHVSYSGIRKAPLAIGLLSQKHRKGESPNMAEIGRIIGKTRQAVRGHASAATAALTAVDRIIKEAIPLPPSPDPADRTRVTLQRQVVAEALTSVAVARQTRPSERLRR